MGFGWSYSRAEGFARFAFSKFTQDTFGKEKRGPVRSRAVCFTLRTTM
jgi:hypothetical protein